MRDVESSSGREAGVGTPPLTLTISFVIWVVHFILATIGSILAIAAVTASPTPNAGASVGVLVAGAIVAILFGLVQVFFAFRMRAGRTWARIVLTVLGLVSIATELFEGAGLLTASWIATALAVILMFGPAASAYFRGVAGE